MGPIVSRAAFRPFTDTTPHAVYAMDRISALAEHYAIPIRNRFYLRHRAAAPPNCTLPPESNGYAKVEQDLDRVAGLVQAHFQNNPYYPFARPQDPIYTAFRTDTSKKAPNDEPGRSIAQAFLSAIEAEQTRCDANDS
ncbi:hypothetical protein BS47DRAFT_1392196 [Hydnum rufescens UP504]|uniref:Uncharacterized protein n=1 Tax=Hydnum rufescens UP504 TaxID=1448309 RepID=A0A9P6DYC1_9AGAM|nr:hypothetical protein BS47DRAFT_1392196 [Hydnum rufescens UP504]